MFAKLLTSPLWLATLAVGVGTGVDALVKAFAPGAGLHHLLAWRFGFGALIAVSVFRAKKRPAPSLEAIKFHTSRGLLQLGGAFLFFYALTQLPLALATIIGFTASLMVPFVARLLLAEPVSPKTLLATLAGFGGAILSISGMPETGAEEGNRLLGLVACFAAAGLYALILVMLRMRATREDATTIAMFTNLVPALALLPITIGLFGTVDWAMLPLFALLGLLGYGVWFTMTLAYAQAPAQKLAPLEYTALVWSGLLGAIFFQEFPGWQTWLGGLIIIGACLYVALDGKFRTRRETGQPASDIPE